jgi:uncharacterized membrane protein YhaH (DUF805 family)
MTGKVGHNYMWFMAPDVDFTRSVSRFGRNKRVENMNMITAVKTVLGKYATFEGRAARPEYWWWILAMVILFTILGVVDGALIAPLMGFEPFQKEAGQPLSLLVSLGLLLPNLALAVRRLHDTDRSGWWLLIGLIPIVGSLVLLVFYLLPGTQGQNRFG